MRNTKKLTRAQRQLLVKSGYCGENDNLSGVHYLKEDAGSIYFKEIVNGTILVYDKSLREVHTLENEREASGLVKPSQVTEKLGVGNHD